MLTTFRIDSKKFEILISNSVPLFRSRTDDSRPEIPLLALALALGKVEFGRVAVIVR